MPWKYSPPQLFGMTPEVRREVQRLQQLEADHFLQSPVRDAIEWLSDPQTAGWRRERIFKATGYRFSVSAGPASATEPKKPKKSDPWLVEQEKILDRALSPRARAREG